MIVNSISFFPSLSFSLCSSVDDSLIVFLLRLADAGSGNVDGSVLQQESISKSSEFTRKSYYTAKALRVPLWPRKQLARAWACRYFSLQPHVVAAVALHVLRQSGSHC